MMGKAVKYQLLTETNATRTEFIDTNYLIPSSLQELKKDKNFIKMLMKCDKDLAVLKKKHDEFRENVQEVQAYHIEKLVGQQIKKENALEKSHIKNLKQASKEGIDIDSVQRQNQEEFVRLQAEQNQKLNKQRRCNAEVIVEMSKSHYQAELTMFVHHNVAIYEMLKVIMDQNHREHINKIQLIHDQEDKDLVKKIDSQFKEEMKRLAKCHKDNDVLSRLRLEIQKQHIETLAAERAELKEIQGQRLEELHTKLDRIREELEKDKKLAVKEQEEQFHKRCKHLEDDYREFLNLDIQDKGPS